MVTEQKLREEIERIKCDMVTAPETSRDHQIGALAALAWAAGDYDRGTAFSQACQAWDKARPTAPGNAIPLESRLSPF